MCAILHGPLTMLTLNIFLIFVIGFEPQLVSICTPVLFLLIHLSSATFDPFLFVNQSGGDVQDADRTPVSDDKEIVPGMGVNSDGKLVRWRNDRVLDYHEAVFG